MDVKDADIKKMLVRKQACFSQLTDKEIEVLSSLLVERHIPAGSTIVTEGDLVDSVYIIVRGTADVRHITIQDGAPHIQSLAKLNPPEAIGLNEQGFYSLSGVRTATVVADTDMDVLYLSVAAFHGFALSYPHVNEVMRTYATKMVDTNPGS